MDSLNHHNQADVTEALNSKFDFQVKNIDNPYFEDIVNQIYPPELKMNKANNTYYTEAPFLDLHLSVANGFVPSVKFMISALTLILRGGGGFNTCHLLDYPSRDLQ